MIVRNMIIHLEIWVKQGLDSIIHGVIRNLFGISLDHNHRAIHMFGHVRAHCSHKHSAQKGCGIHVRHKKNLTVWIRTQSVDVHIAFWVTTKAATTCR